jgi:hypothetical protein
MVDSLTPLLISRSISRVATTVLYAHPHVSEGKLDRFINTIQKPSMYLALDNKVSLVHHLTVRPTPIRHDNGPDPTNNGKKGFVDTSLPRLARLFPILKSFVLRDCLIYTQQDAITVFSSLPLMTPQKARLEIRMWPLTDDQVGRELALATKFGTRGFVRRETSPYSSYGLEGRWRDALYGDRDLELPADWLDPDERNRANNEERARRQAAIPAVQVAAPHDVVDPQNPLGPRLQIPVAGMDPLGRAIELCRDVFRTDFARTSVPYDMSIRGELVRMGPFRPQMTRQHASIVLQRLGHHLPANAPECNDQDIVKRANLWANSSRVRVIQEAQTNRQSTSSSTAHAVGPESHPSAQVHSAKLAVLAAVHPSADLQTPPRLHRKSREIASMVAAFNRRSDESNASPYAGGSRDAPIGVDDSEYDDEEAEYALFQEGLRQSRLQLQAFPQRETASSSITRGGPASGSTTNGASVESEVVTSCQGDKSTEAPPLNATQDLDQAVPTTTQTGDTVAGAENVSTGTPSPPPPSISENVRSGLSAYRSIRRSIINAAEDDMDSDHTSSTRFDASAADGWSMWHEQQMLGITPELWSGVASSSGPPLNNELPQTSTDPHHANNATGPDHALISILPLIQELMVTEARRHPARLASAIRKQMLHLIENTWSPTLQAFSLVTLDPLASIIAQAPQLDLWVNIPVPHIRVQLPRSINSLAIFKGTAENARDRSRLYARSIRPVVEDNRDANAHTTSLRDQYPQTQVVEPIVGGDGSGGGLVHPNTRLFEVEVNTIREMIHDMWNQAGAELPPQVCRILTGTQDWSEVGLRKSFPFLTSPHADHQVQTANFVRKM